MRPATGYKIVGGVLIGAAIVGTALVLSGEEVKAPIWLYALIGFLLYWRGMRLAAREPLPREGKSVHLAVVSAWLRQLFRRDRI